MNLIDNRIPTEPLQRPFMGKADARFSSAEEQRSGAGLVEFQLGRVVVHLDGFKRATEDIEIPGFARSERLRRLQPLAPGEREPHGTLPNSAGESEGGAAGASFVWEGGYVGTSYSVFDSNYGTVAEPDVTIDLEQQRWDVRGAFNKPFTPIKAINYKWSLSDYTHTEFEGAEIGTVFDVEGYDGRLEVLHEKLGLLRGRHRLSDAKHRFLRARRRGVPADASKRPRTQLSSSKRSRSIRCGCNSAVATITRPTTAARIRSSVRQLSARLRCVQRIGWHCLHAGRSRT